jgi:hypothetical protein
MANTLYKAAVQELETVLPPRLVSQSLQGGLSAVGETDDTVSRSDVETILRDWALPQLTQSLGAAEAQRTLQEILERLSQTPDVPQSASGLGTQATAVRLLQTSLKPFNLYFEWSETQKLRAQLSLIESEHAEGRDAGALIAAAQAQLGVLQQKLNDQLSVQAREVVLLEAALESSRALDTPKVRRLAGLLELVRGAQEAQQHAPAEVERAHKLAGELRAEKLRLLDEEARELRALRESFATLLALEPPLAERLAAYQGLVEAETLLGGPLRALRSELEAAQETLRHNLKAEFETLASEARNPELRQLLTLSLKVLETTLPPPADVQRVRDLLRAGGADPKLAEFHRLEAEAEGYRELPSTPSRELGAFLGGGAGDARAKPRPARPGARLAFAGAGADRGGAKRAELCGPRRQRAARRRAPWERLTPKRPPSCAGACRRSARSKTPSSASRRSGRPSWGP